MLSCWLKFNKAKELESKADALTNISCEHSIYWVCHNIINCALSTIYSLYSHPSPWSFSWNLRGSKEGLGTADLFHVVLVHY